MPVFFQQQINAATRLGIWKIEEPEEFFRDQVPLQQTVTHPHKRVQHLAGRFLLRYLFADFPYHLIQIADTRKPFLPGEEFHFSISHSDDYAAAIVSRSHPVGIDAELIREQVGRLVPKFLSGKEQELLRPESLLEDATLCWTAKESVFKWYGKGSVDFRKEINLQAIHPEEIQVHFTKTESDLIIRHHRFDHLMLAWLIS